MPNIEKIIIWPDSVLDTETQTVLDFDKELSDLLERLKITMEYHQGVGIAANQIDVPYKVALVTREDNSLLEIINPTIIAKKGNLFLIEGCLSIPSFSEKVQRYEEITVAYQDRAGQRCVGTYDGRTAHVIQHEVDHLNGLVYVKHLSSLKRDIIRRKMLKTHKGHNNV